MYPKFESTRNCVKCGRPQFHTTGEQKCMAKRTYVPRSFAKGDTPGSGIVPEHLDVTCCACGYTWQEACKDATA